MYSPDNNWLASQLANGTLECRLHSPRSVIRPFDQSSRLIHASLRTWSIDYHETILTVSLTQLWTSCLYQHSGCQARKLLIWMEFEWKRDKSTMTWMHLLSKNIIYSIFSPKAKKGTNRPPMKVHNVCWEGRKIPNKEQTNVCASFSEARNV